jgi:predicted MFS family arabinose efflux permease
LKASHRGLTLVLLTAVYGVNFIDRQIVGLLLEPIKHDLELSDTALGFLTGIAFAIFYTGCALPIARLAEVWRPKLLIAASVALFSVATAAGAFAMNYAQLLLARILVGVGEGGTTPASTAILARLYPEDRRTGVMAFWSTGAQVGVLIGYVVAAIIAARYGWRAGFIVAGVPGLLIALLVLKFVQDPEPKNALRPRPIMVVLSELSRNRSFVLLCLAGGAALFAVNALVGWTPAYLQRAFHLSLPTVGWIFGVSVGVLGALTTWGSGRLADRFHKFGAGGPLLMAAASLLLYFCLQVGALWSPQAHLAIGLLVPGLALGLVWQGPVFALIQRLSAEGERPTAVALFVFVANAVGLGLGPLLVGLISDAVGHGTAAGLRIGITCALGAAPLAAILLIVTARTIGASELESTPSRLRVARPKL